MSTPEARRVAELEDQVASLRAQVCVSGIERACSPLCARVCALRCCPPRGPGRRTRAAASRVFFLSDAAPPSFAPQHPPRPRARTASRSLSTCPGGGRPPCGIGHGANSSRRPRRRLLPTSHLSPSPPPTTRARSFPTQLTHRPTPRPSMLSMRPWCVAGVVGRARLWSEREHRREVTGAGPRQAKQAAAAIPAVARRTSLSLTHPHLSPPPPLFFLRRWRSVSPPCPTRSPP